MRFKIKTKGQTDIIDITSKIEEIVKKSGVTEGLVSIFVIGSTVALTTIEYEEGLIKDLKNILEKIIPTDIDYEHHQRWGDFNGAAHLRSALLKTDLTVPIENNKLVLGTWQQIVLIDFDEKPREREVVVKIILTDNN